MTAVLDHASELEKLLLDHDVTVFGYERSGDVAIVRFILNDQKLRLVVGMPDWNADKYLYTPTRHDLRSMTERRRLYWNDVAATWKTMKELIRAKLNAVEAGITTFDAEFGQFADGIAQLGAGDGSEPAS